MATTDRTELGRMVLQIESDSLDGSRLRTLDIGADSFAFRVSHRLLDTLSPTAKADPKKQSSS